MITSNKPLLSRLWAMSVMLCLTLTLGMGFVSTQARLSILEHQVNGDRLLSDGGWVSDCEHLTCSGHAESNAPAHSDDVTGNHHHHFSETNTSPLPAAAAPQPPVSADLRLLPHARDRSPDGTSPDDIDQPPRIPSRL